MLPIRTKKSSMFMKNSIGQREQAAATHTRTKHGKYEDVHGRPGKVQHRQAGSGLIGRRSALLIERIHGPLGYCCRLGMG